MKKVTILITIMLAMLAVAPCFAQQMGTVTFGYDADGNRTGWTISFQKEAENGKGISEANDLSGATATAEDSFAEMQVSLYPNPTAGTFSVALQNRTDGKPMQAVLTSPTGAVLAEKRFESNLEQFDLSDQAAGIYFLKLIVGDEVHVWRVIRR